MRLIRQRAIARAASLIVGFWFALSVAEPVALHSCPMHSAHGGTMASMGGRDRATHAGHSTAGMLADAASDHSPPPPENSHKACMCLGGCCAARLVASPATPEVATVEIAVPAGLPRLTTCGIRRFAPDFDHPYSNGPPV
jgi:hypothetical protein